MASFYLSPARLFADAVTDYNLAVQFYKQERWKLAAEACEDFVKKHPEHVQVPMAQLYLGQSLVHLREFDKARERFKIYLQDPRAKSDRALAMYRVGECSYFLNDLKTAEEELAEFLSNYPEHELSEWAVVYLAQSQFQLNKVPQSIQSFEQALKKFENGKLKDEVEYGLARAFEVDGQTEKASGLYRKIAAQKSNPQASNAQFHLAALSFSQGQYAEADVAFQTLAREFPEDRLVSLAQLNSGYANYQLKQFEIAIERFQQASKTESQKLTANYWIGLSYKSLGDYTKAVSVFRTTLSESADQPLAENILFQVGDAELRLKNYKQSLADFSAVYTRWPEGKYGDDALHSACEVALQAGELTQAAELHQKFVSQYANSGLRQVQDLLYSRILIAMGDQAKQTGAEHTAFYQKAVEVLNLVIAGTSVEETLRFGKFQLARTYERLGQDEELILILKPMLSTQNSFDQLTLDSLLLLANAKLRQKDFSGAAQDYTLFLEHNQAAELSRAGYVGLISSYIDLQEWKTVVTNLKLLEALDPQNAHFSQLCLAAGDAAFEHEDWENAESFFQLGIQRETNNSYFPSALSGLGHTLYKQEKYAAAANSFKQLTLATMIDAQLSAHAWYMWGMSERQSGHMQAALVIYRDGLQKLRGDIKSQSPVLQETAYSLAKNAARVARELEEREQADAFYRDAQDFLQLLPEKSEDDLDKLLFEWADMHYNAEDYTQADRLFQRLIQLKPDSSLADDAALILAESLRFSGKAPEAEAAFRKLTSSPLADDFVKQRSYIHLVDLNAEQKKWEQLLSDAETLKNNYPASEHRLYLDYRSAEALLQTQDAEKASGLLSQLHAEVLALGDSAPPWWEEVWLLQAESFLQLKNYVKLEETIESLRTRSPASKGIHRGDLLLGRGFENQAKFDEARAAYTRAIESESGKGTETAAEAQFRIAESFLKQNNFETALKEYYKVYAGYDAPHYEAAALYQAARSDVKLKSWKGAVQTYRILLQEFPESEYVKDARKQLADIETAFPELKRESP